MNADVANGGNADNNNNNTNNTTTNNNDDDTEDKEKVRGKCKKVWWRGGNILCLKKLNEPFLLTAFR